MHSRLLANLNEEMRKSGDSVSWARAVCRTASHFARQGQSEQALEEIAKVRAHFGNQLDSEVACWLMLTEGILHFFQMHSADAFDRLRRAYGLAVAANATIARPSCAAWMAHIEFNECRFRSMITYLGEAFMKASSEDHQAIGRASLVLADAYHFAGDFAKARPWYQRTRLHATAEGDEATLSALLHNVAAFRAANVRLADAFGDSSLLDAHQASLEASSALNFDKAIGTASFQLLVPLLQGQLLTVDGNFTAALDLFRSIEPKSLPQRLVPLLQIDQAWCLASVGSIDEARSSAASAIESSSSISEPDDRAYVLARYAQVSELLCNELAGDSWIAAGQALAEHQSVQADLSTQLDELVARITK